MIDYREGAKINSACAYCEKSVASTLTNETLSLCEGLEEVENVLVRVCDECGNMVSIPARSEPPIQEAYKKLIDSGLVPESGEITTELKSLVEARKSSNKISGRNSQQEYPLVAAGEG